MCKHSFWINNKYLYQTHVLSRARILASCGDCKECQQVKANRRASRIIYEYNNKDTICLYVTLDYANRYVPYFKLNEAIDFFTYNKIDNLPIYRDCTRSLDWHSVYVPSSRLVRRVGRRKQGEGLYDIEKSKTLPFQYHKLPKTYTFSFGSDSHCGVIDNINFDNLDYNETIQYLLAFNTHYNAYNGINYWRKGKIIASNKNKIPVLLYDDFQKFIKRLRKNMSVRNTDKVNFKYCVSSEYGETFQRCHWHCLFFFRPEFESTFRQCIIDSWPFSDMLRTNPEAIQLATNPAQYVASYVNSSTDLPYFLSHAKKIKPSFHSSKVFGFDGRLFTFDSIQRQIDRGTLRYNSVTYRKGQLTDIFLPIPKYVINRYFPKFKGYTWFTSSELSRIIETIYKRDFGSLLDFFFSHHLQPVLQYTVEDVHKIYIMFKNRLKNYAKDLFSYIFYYLRSWTLRASEALKLLHQSVTKEEDILYLYDNLRDYKFIKNELIDSLLKIYKPVSYNPIKFPLSVARSEYLEDVFDKRMKKRKVLECAHYNI